jgi:DNA-binding response OmpR family regulator
MDRILMVDDDEGMRKLVKERLRGSYDVVDTGNPSEAVSLALDLRPKCILLDLVMPGLTGFEVCKTLSSLSLTQNTPVLIISGNPIGEYRDFCSHLGARDYFQKPVDFVRLRTRIAELISEDLPDRRAELRVKMHVGIELRGLNRYGKAFHEVTETQNVSVNGFRCACGTSLDQKSVVEVFLRGSDAKRRIGRAEVVHVLSRNLDVPQYGFHFTQKPSEWLL